MSTLNTPFVPPFFKDFGKTLKDLIEKQYNVFHKLEVKTTSPSGVAFTSSALQTPKGIIANLLVNYQTLNYVTEAEVDTAGLLRGEIYFDKLYNGLKVTLSGTDLPSGKLAVDYKQDMVAVNASVTADETHLVGETALAVGASGASVGASAKFDTKVQALTDYNAGAQYENSDFICSVKTTNKAEVLNLGYVHRVSSSTLVGAQFDYNLENDAKSLIIATEHALASDSSAKVKAKLHHKGLVNLHYSQRLNPGVKLGLSTAFDASDLSRETARFGATLSFGDF